VQEHISPTERLRKLVMVVANILAPVPEASLLANAVRFRALGDIRSTLRDLLKAGELEKEAIDGVTYLWPHIRAIRKQAPRMARFLAPFDPLVWDRRRFEHFWGWAYRFEAYTPIARRVRGYYAMPLLWCDSVIGWGNARVERERLIVDIGYVKKCPEDRDFRPELDTEIAHLEAFLSLR